MEVSNLTERGIYHDLLRKFRDDGHDVTIVTPVERRRRIATNFNDREGVSILQVKTFNIQKTNFIEKGVGTLAIEYQYLVAIKKYTPEKKFDLVLYSTPPITFAKVIEFIKKRDHAKSYLLLKDIFPQNAVDLGILKKNGILHRYFKHKENQLYAVSDHIGCMSPANVEYITKYNFKTTQGKVEINPNSIELSKGTFDEVKVDGIKAQYGIPHNTVVFVYGGNLGKPQGIDFLIQILLANQNNRKIFFLIVGNGTEYQKLKDMLDLNRLQNILLINALPKKQYDELLSCCDIGLIFLDRRFSIPNFPSRLLSYLEYKMPVISATDSATDIGSIMESNQFGIGVLSGNLEAFNAAIDKLSNDAGYRKRLGENGYNYLLSNYLVKNSYDAIMKHYRNV